MMNMMKWTFATQAHYNDLSAGIKRGFCGVVVVEGPAQCKPASVPSSLGGSIEAVSQSAKLQKFASVTGNKSMALTPPLSAVSVLFITKTHPII